MNKILAVFCVQGQVNNDKKWVQLSFNGLSQIGSIHKWRLALRSLKDGEFHPSPNLIS